MNVKELKEILNGLPDDATVIVSEKYGRGGHIQGRIIGELKDDCWVQDTYDCDTSYWDKEIEHANKVISAVKSGLYKWTPAKDGTESDVMTGDEGCFLMQTWAGESHKWTEQKIISYFEKKIDEANKKIKKLLERAKKGKVNAIELSCAF